MGPGMRYELAVFDFDGTLMDTREAIVATIQEVLGAEGFDPPPADEIWRRVGSGLHLVLGDLTGMSVDGEAVERLAGLYIARFDEVAPGRTRLIDGIAGALEQIREAGVRLAIATNRGRPSLERILAEHGLLDDFECLVTSHCVPRPKPFTDMLESVLRQTPADRSRVLMIGDTTVDMAMGRAAKIDTCAVTYGAHSHEDLLGEQPTYVVHHAADLPAVLKGNG